MLRFRPASDRALLVYLGDEISGAVHRRVLALLRSLQRANLPWLQSLQPAYSSILVAFDLLQIDHPAVEAAIRECAARSEEATAAAVMPRLIEIPVCYAAEFAPDLAALAESRGLSTAQVVELHSSQTYLAYFLGFAPGFAYLGDLPAELEAPRLAAPRTRVPAGSVGIAGRQTGVYPFSTPGGWRIIGRTPLRMFDPGRQPMNIISIGDHVRFVPISLAEFQKQGQA
jgi:KipI family sensor histidine kinase inhibitor